MSIDVFIVKRNPFSWLHLKHVLLELETSLAVVTERCQAEPRILLQKQDRGWPQAPSRSVSIRGHWVGGHFPPSPSPRNQATEVAPGEEPSRKQSNRRHGEWRGRRLTVPRGHPRLLPAPARATAGPGPILQPEWELWASGREC